MTPSTQAHPDPAAPSFTERIQQFYDESSQLWEQVWGEHMHHGYYGSDVQTSNPQEAQRVLIERILTWSDTAISAQNSTAIAQTGDQFQPQSIFGCGMWHRRQYALPG